MVAALTDGSCVPSVTRAALQMREEDEERSRCAGGRGLREEAPGQLSGPGLTTQAPAFGDPGESQGSAGEQLMVAGAQHSKAVWAGGL